MKRTITTILFLALSILMLFSQAPSTQGKEFWVSFMKNYELAPGLEFELIISAKKVSTGTIKNPNTGWNTTFTVSPNVLTNIKIPQSEAYISSSGKVEDKGLLVTSTDTISLYASNFLSASFDVANVLPTHALSDEYMVQTYPSEVWGSEFLVIATEDNTIVDITPTVRILPDEPANVPFSVTLNKGQAYQTISYSIKADLSGSIVKARDCKKIALFNGNMCAKVPSGCAACDHIVEQAFPTAYWGKKFAVTSTFGRSADRVRITALKDETTIKIDGTEAITLGSGKTYEFELSANQGSCYIETSKPSTVNLYLLGVECGGSTNGDPSMVLINPVEQQIKEITFGTFQTAKTKSHYVNVITATNDVNSMTLDGNSIANEFSTLTGNAALSFAQIPISYGSHQLKSNTGFIAHVYGLGKAESYAYSVGSSAVTLNKQMVINGKQSNYLSTNQKYCKNSVLNFESVVDYEYKDISWNFGDGKIAKGEKVSHSYSAFGDFQVDLIIQRNVTNCSGALYDTLSVKLNIPVTEKVIQDKICSGETYSNYGFNVNALKDETLTQKYQTKLGCDSLVTLVLKVNQPTSSTTEATISENESYSFNGENYSIVGTYSAKLTNTVGCDSIATLILNADELNIPDFFTPNGDGFHDTWEIGNINSFSDADVYIFDRFGKQLSRYTGSEQGWNGTYKGKPLPPDDYWYRIVLNKKKKSYTGHFTLVR